MSTQTGTAGEENRGPGGARRPGESGGRAAAGGPLEAATERPPAEFTREIRAALRYEAGVAVKAGAVLAVLAVLIILRALYLV
jgi:hypothetical protein